MTKYITIDKADEIIKYAAEHRKDPSIGSFVDYLKKQNGWGPEVELEVTVQADWGMELSGKDLSKADFSNVTFSGLGIEFGTANLTDVKFSGANLYDCDLRHCKTDGIIVDSKTYTDTANLTKEQSAAIEQQKLESRPKPSQVQVDAESRTREIESGVKVLASAAQVVVTAGVALTGFGAAVAPLAGLAAQGVVRMLAPTGESGDTRFTRAAVATSRMSDRVVRRVSGPSQCRKPSGEDDIARQKELQQSGFNTYTKAAGIVVGGGLMALGGLVLHSPEVSALGLNVAAAAFVTSVAFDGVADAVADTTLGDHLEATGAKRGLVKTSFALPVYGEFTVPGLGDALTVACVHSKQAQKTIGVAEAFEIIEKGLKEKKAARDTEKDARSHIKHNAFRTAITAAIIASVVVMAVIAGAALGQFAIVGALTASAIVGITAASAIVAGTMGFYVHKTVEKSELEKQKQTIASIISPDKKPRKESERSSNVVKAAVAALQGMAQTTKHHEIDEDHKPTPGHTHTLRSAGKAVARSLHKGA